MHVRKLVLAVLSGSLAVGSVVLTAGAASATACGPTVPITAGNSCTMTGTVTLTAGPLTLASPTQLGWVATLTGANLALYDTTGADEQYTVIDATGSLLGWHVTTSATTFTNGSATLPNTGTFVTTGSISSISGTTAPTATCVSGTTCILPTARTTYPVAITTAASSPTPATIYDTAALTGVGQIVIGGSTAANPVGWWINLPGDASSGAYTSTITMSLISAP